MHVVLPLLYNSIEQLLQTDGYLTSNPKKLINSLELLGSFWAMILY